MDRDRQRDKGSAVNPQPKPTTWRSEYYMHWVKDNLPCCVDICSVQDETMVYHHAGIGGEAIKAADDTVIPFCHKHHMAIHALNGNGYFADVDNLDEWRLLRINDTVEAFLASLHDCHTRDCERDVDFDDDVTREFFEDGDLLCAQCRCPVDEGEEFDKEAERDRRERTA